jgi:PAS domain S-box-containing protein
VLRAGRTPIGTVALPLAIAGALTAALVPWDELPLMLAGSVYVAAVVACTLAAGRTAGYVTALGATIFSAVFLLSADDIVGLIAFLAASILVTAVLDRAGAARAEATRARQSFAAVVDASPVPVVVLDRAGLVEVWNHAAEEVFGWKAHEVVGRPYPTIPTDEAPTWSHDVFSPVMHGQTFTAVEVQRRRKDGSLVDVMLSAAPIRTAGGSIIGGVGVLADLSPIRDAEEQRNALRERERRALAELAETGARLASVIATAVDAIITIEADGTIDTFNHAAELLFGYSADEVHGRNVSMLMPSPDREQHDGYLRRYLAGGEPRIIGTGRHVVAQRRDGSRVPVHLSVSEVHLPGRRLFTGVVRDVTADVQAVERAEELQRLTAAVAAALEPEDVADEVIRTACRAFDADGGQVAVLNTLDGRLAVAATIGAATGRTRLAPEGRAPEATALRGRRPVYVTDVTQADEPWDLPADVRAFVALPLLYTGVAIGALVLTFRRPVDFTTEDERFLSTAAAIAAAALSRARLHANERRIALTLQRSMLPTALPEVPGLELAAAYRAGTTGMQIGGDWYDAVPVTDRRVVLAIGDVAGRGIDAATVMARVRSAFHALAHVVESPGRLLGELNEQLAIDADVPFVTGCVLVIDLDRRAITYAIAGHPPPVLTDARGARLLGGAVGMPLATQPDVVYPEHVEKYDTPASLVVYTDGLVERRDESIDVGLDRLLRAAELGRDTARGLCDDLLEELLLTESFDDAAVVVARIDDVFAG